MGDLRSCLLRVVAAAVLGSVAMRLVNQGSAGRAVRLAAGIVMILTLFNPLIRIQLENVEFYLEDIRAAGEDISEDGKNAAQDAIRQRISSQMGSYILDKAGTMGAVLDVEVELDGYVPCRVILRGSVSPYSKAVLESYISEQFGIGREAQTWIS